MVNYITLGSACSPNAALSAMGLRRFALPFDWMRSPIEGVENCFADNFSRYHLNLTLCNTKSRVFDEYGFGYAHDYPTESSGAQYPYPESTIVDNYETYKDNVREKYKRRIQRFLDIMQDPSPIICLCRRPVPDVVKLQSLLATYYNKENVYFINADAESFENQTIISRNCEIDGTWNDVRVWKEMHALMMQRIIACETT